MGYGRGLSPSPLPRYGISGECLGTLLYLSISSMMWAQHYTESPHCTSRRTKMHRLVSLQRSRAITSPNGAEKMTVKDQNSPPYRSHDPQKQITRPIRWPLRSNSNPTELHMSWELERGRLYVGAVGRASPSQLDVERLGGVFLDDVFKRVERVNSNRLWVRRTR